MKEHRNSEEELRAILKEHGLEKPAEQYSSHLRNVIVSKYRKNQHPEFAGYKWLAPVIFGMAIVWNLLAFYFVNPFSVQPVLSISIIAFILGLWGLILLIKKSQMSFFNSP